MNTVRPEAAELLLAPVFQAHVEGHGFDWAIAVFATSAIHQGSIRRLLGPFLLSIPRNRFCHGHHAASDRGCTAHTKNRRIKMNSSPCATLRVPQALGGY